MNFIAFMLGVILIVLVVAVDQGDPMVCKYAKRQITSYRVCLELTECDVNTDDIEDMLWGLSYITEEEKCQ